MKDWKFIQVGNTAHSDKVDVIKRLLAGGWSVQDIYEQLKTEGYEVEKNFIEKLKTGNSEAENRYTIPQASKEYDRLKAEYQKTKSEDIKKQIDDLKETIRYETMMATSYFDQLDGKKKDLMYNEGKEGKVHYWNEARKNMEEWKKLRNRVMAGNESIDKQEWSMFKGLTKKAESEVGNTWEWNVKDSDVIDYVTGVPSATTLQRLAQKHLGTYDTRSVQAFLVDRNSDKWAVVKAGVKPTVKSTNKVGNKKYHIWTDNGTWDRIVDEEELKRLKTTYVNFHYEEVGNNKVGNVLPPSGLYAKLLDEICEKEGIDSNKAREKYGQYSIEQWEKLLGRKIGNSLPHDYHNRYPSDPIYADMKSSAQLESIKKEPWRVYDIMGVGDSIARERVFEMIEEKYGIDYNDIYEAWLGKSWDKAVQKKSFDEAKKLAQKLGLRFGNKTGNADTVSEYNAEIQRLTKKAEQLRRMGQGRSAMEIEKQIEKLGRELREIGNEKTGNAGQWNSTKTIYGKWDDKAGRPAEEYARITWLGQGKGGLVNIWKGNQMTSEKYGSNDLDDLRRWSEQRIGNETLAEYAKSKPRIINNLHRARNAMAKNKQITLWDGNDSVLISEDGTVQYLESNSFEVDRGKYDSQQKAVEELTKQGYRKKIKGGKNGQYTKQTTDLF